MLPYKNKDEIRDRYVGSVIFHNDIPVFVSQITGFSLTYQKVGPDFRQNHELPFKDDGFRDGPFRLGYTNGMERLTDDGIVMTTSFCQRLPVRRFKQGLTDQNIEMSGEFNFSRSLTSKGFASMLMGDYPKMSFVRANLGKKVRSLAFHRHWAYRLGTTGLIELEYRRTTVGLGEDTQSVRLGKTFKYLQEGLDVAVEGAEG